MIVQQDNLKWSYNKTTSSDRTTRQPQVIVQQDNIDNDSKQDNSSFNFSDFNLDKIYSFTYLGGGIWAYCDTKS